MRKQKPECYRTTEFTPVRLLGVAAPGLRSLFLPSIAVRRTGEPMIRPAGLRTPDHWQRTAERPLNAFP